MAKYCRKALFGAGRSPGLAAYSFSAEAARLACNSA